MLEFLDPLIAPIKHDLLHWEIVSTIFAIISVIYARRENILVYPTGLIGVGIAVYLCFQFKLYADSGINAYYFIMSIYGWFMWSKNTEGSTLAISWNSKKEQLASIGLTLLFFPILVFALSQLTDSPTPIWDALSTSFALVAMWLMARKKVENWIYWIITNIISIPLYAYKGLYFYSIQYGVFLLLAISGLILWKQKVGERKIA